MRPVSDFNAQLLAKVRPTSVRLLDKGGASHVINVPKNRKRWTTTATSIEAYEWTRLEMMDETGGVLRAVQAPGALGTAAPDESNVATIISEVQRVVLAAHVEAQRDLLNCVKGMADSAMKQSAATADAMASMTAMIADLAVHAAGAQLAQAEAEAEAVAAGNDAAETDKLVSLAGEVLSGLRGDNGEAKTH